MKKKTYRSYEAVESLKTKTHLFNISQLIKLEENHVRISRDEY